MPSGTARSTAGRALVGRALAGLCLSALAVAGASTTAGADPVSVSQTKVNQLGGQLHSAQAQAAAIASQLQVDGVKLDQLSQQYEVAEQKVGMLDVQLAQTRVAIQQTQARVAVAQANLRAAALQTYMSGSSDAAGLESLFTSGGQQSLIRAEYRRVETSNISSAIDALHVAQSALNTQQGQLQATETQARTAASQVASARNAAQALQAQQRAALGQASAQVAHLVVQKQQADAQLASAQFQAQLAAEGGSGGTVSNVPVSADAGGAVKAAESQLGVPYQWGGESPKGSAYPGFDCSGLTQWSWGQAGVSIPRTAQEQYDAIPHVSLNSLQPGDLVFWDDGTSSVQHVGMYVGNGNVIDAPQTGQNVQIQPIWTNGLVGAGRP